MPKDLFGKELRLRDIVYAPVWNGSIGIVYRVGKNRVYLYYVPIDQIPENKVDFGRIVQHQHPKWKLWQGSFEAETLININDKYD